MSSPANQNLSSRVICPNCRRENAAGNQFCRYCKKPLPALVQDEAPRVVEPDPPAGPGVTGGPGVSRTPAPAPPETSTAPITDLHSQSKGAEIWAGALQSELSTPKDKLKEAEEKLAASEKELIARTENTAKGIVQKAPEIKQQASARLKAIAGALTVLGGLGGYGTGRYAVPKDDTKASQLAAQVTNAQKEIVSLKSKLDSVTQSGGQVETDLKTQLAAATQTIGDLTTKTTGISAQQHQLETKLAAAQKDLAAAETQANTANAKVQAAEATAAQRTTQITALNQHVKELTASVQARDTEVADLKKRLATTEAAIPRSGTLIWSGVIVGKRKIEIKDGVADYGSFSGALPRTPYTVAVQDPAHVQLKTLPSARNQWNRLAFEVSGIGNVQVRINWVLSQ